MKKINIIQKADDFNNIIKNGKRYKNKYYYVYKDRNIYKKYRFGICVSKKIGNAVIRNKNKRQMKDIIDKSNFLFSSNMDYVIILKKEINELSYQEKKENLLNLLQIVLKGENNEEK